MLLLRRFALMLQFLTTIPLPVRLDAGEEDYGKGLVFAPLVGLVLGLILSGVYSVLRFISPALVTSVLTVIAYIVLTGGLHLDGLGDTFDGLFSNRSRERMLEIMRDSRIGTNGVLAIVSVLLLNISLLSAVETGRAAAVLMMMPVAGRTACLIGSGISAYARSGEGLGKSFIDYCRTREIIWGLLLHFIIFLVVEGPFGLLLSIIPVATAFLLIWFLTRKIGGATGDILGAVCELNQTLFLIAIFLC
jgi:adenosylcobinamide-GDP ribazoletransferase